MTWIREKTKGTGRLEVWHQNSVPWYTAPLPLRWHRCRPQTQAFGSFSGYTMVERCACGATRLDGHGPWVGKNETRKMRQER